MPSGIVVLVAQLWLWGLPDQLDEDDGDAGDSEEVGNEKVNVESLWDPLRGLPDNWQLRT